MGNHIKQLLKGSVSDQVLAEGVGVANEVAKSACSVSASLFLLVLEEVNKKLDAGA